MRVVGRHCPELDAGGDQRQMNYWVEDRADQEAEKLLALHGRREDWERRKMRKVPNVFPSKGLSAHKMRKAKRFVKACVWDCAALVGVPFRRLPRRRWRPRRR